VKETIEKILAGEILSEADAHDLMSQIMEGSFNDIEISGFLVALRARKESACEITGFARAMRDKMISVPLDVEAVDLCGTGGDGSGTFNISTAACFVVAGAGVPVAKHGNRSVSSRSGSADVLEALGVGIDLPVDSIRKAVETIGLGFFFAPGFHPAMKSVMPARRALKIRTVFNLLGPLCNPCGVKHQLLGVYDKEWILPIAEVLRNLGAKSAMVVHGEGGLDELTLTGTSFFTRLHDSELKEGSYQPSELGFERIEMSDLRGGDARENAGILLGILDGREGPALNMTLVNAASAIAIARGCRYEEGLAMARESVNSGRAKEVLVKLRELS